ncbi:MAG: RNA helicase, partial [Burkholderiaceae bacterium]|nr:RNA helicase [Burkholderiaceae bacterium]
RQPAQGQRPQGQGGGGQPRQPDPLRTGIDALGERGRNRGRPGRTGGGQGNRQGGGGGGIDPLRTSFGRIK